LISIGSHSYFYFTGLSSYFIQLFEKRGWALIEILFKNKTVHLRIIGQNQSIGVKVTHKEVLLTKTSTEPLDILVYGKKYTLKQTLTIKR